MGFIDVDAVAVTLGVARESLTAVETAQIQDWIGKTERIIKKRLGDLAALDPDAVQDVISEVVARRFKNPDGKQNERIDDYGYGLDKETAKNRLYLTDEEWDQLTPDRAERDVGVTLVAGSPGVGQVAQSAAGFPLRGWWV